MIALIQCHLMARLITLPLMLANGMSGAKEEGKSLGEQGRSKAISQIHSFPSKELVSEGKGGEEFDPEKAKESSEVLEYLRSEEVQKNITPPQEDEYFLTRSENILENSDKEGVEVDEATEHTLQTCRQTDAPYPLEHIRTLNVEVANEPAEIKEVNICRGHEKREIYSKKREAQKAKEQWEKKLSQDPSIKSYNVACYNKGKWRVKPSWIHKDDTSECNNYQTQQVTVKESRQQEVRDLWVYEDEKSQVLSRTPDCTFLKRECLDATPSKVINGKEVKRQCWREKL